MFKLQFDTGNAAFDDDDYPHEIARILREVANRLDRGGTGGPLHDVNGNRIGEWELTA